MKNKSIIILISTILLILITGAGFWIVKNKEIGNKGVPQEKIENNIVAEGSPQQNQEENQKFVVDIDLNVDNWQTKETEFFTIKFPKEWYWLESSHLEREGYSKVITNNPVFDINKHADIGIFSDIGPNSPLIISNNTEIVISEKGKSTSDAGSPLDSLNSTLSLAKENNPSVYCTVVEDRILPLRAYCTTIFNDSGMRQQSYYSINEEIALTFTAWTTQKNSKNLIEVLEKIAESYSYKS